MSFKRLTKKITSYLAATAICVGLTFSSAPTPAEAFGIGDAINIGGALIQGNAQMQKAKQEIEICNNTEEGRQALYQYYRQSCGVNTDPTLNARLDAIMANLSKAVAQIDPSINDKPYLYFVSADKSFNAFCAMGHVMTVNTGAFDMLATDDEIAAIVGHEMGHGQKDHVAKGIKKKLNKQMLAQVGVTAAGGSNLTALIGTIALKNSVAHGDRKFESEADDLAWDYMLKTNYNPGACAATMQRLYEASAGRGKLSGLAKLLNPSDHPDTDKRRNIYLQKLHEYSGKHVSVEPDTGTVLVNGKKFADVAATSNMSAAERACFVLGNLAVAYHNGYNSSDARAVNGTVYLGDRAIITPAQGDEDAQTLAERLNSIK